MILFFSCSSLTNTFAVKILTRQNKEKCLSNIGLTLTKLKKIIQLNFPIGCVLVFHLFNVLPKTKMTSAIEYKIIGKV